MSKTAFKRKAEQLFRSANDGKIAIDWTRCQAVIWHDGTAGWSGTFIATAEGFRTRTVVATDCGGLMVR